jgi:hypothetical protein
MPDLSILNILIAMVIVILVLSLVVQSIQTLIKKLLKLKSRSIVNSLEDLFETISDSPNSAAAAGPQSKTPQELVLDVTNRLKEMGRKSLFGNPMLDSLAKGDLLKILTRVKAEDLLPGTVGNFQTVLAGIKGLEDELGKIETNLLQGEASARFAAMQGSILPLLHDLEALATGGNIDPAVFFGDLYKLRQIKAAEVLDILGQVQKAVSQDLAAAQSARDAAHKALVEAQATNNQPQIESAKQREQEASGKVTAVAAVDTGLKKIANQIAALSNAFDAAFAPVLARLQEVEVWYDTVMQGFEERYARHMRTVAIIVSIGVVVVLNANFFSIYRAIKSDPVKTALIVQQGPAILKSAQQEEVSAGVSKPAATPGQSVTSSATPSPAATPAAMASPNRPPAQTDTAVSVTTHPSPTSTPSPSSVADMKQEAENLDSLVKTYESFGIKPLSRQQISDVLSGRYRWRDVNETILGWALMVMLLSAGAPFWQDTLESLFGLKNLLRQKSDTKNIEGEKGGQPKP